MDADAAARDESLGSPSYYPPSRSATRFIARKAAALSLYAAMFVFIFWLVGPGLASETSPGFEYWTTIGAVLAGFIVLGFLVVITWNQRLARLEHGRLTWPFPFKRKSGVRTRFIALEEVVRMEFDAGPSGRDGAELTLQDGTELFLPRIIFGVDYTRLLEMLVRYVESGSVRG